MFVFFPNFSVVAHRLANVLMMLVFVLITLSQNCYSQARTASQSHAKSRLLNTWHFDAWTYAAITNRDGEREGLVWRPSDGKGKVEAIQIRFQNRKILSFAYDGNLCEAIEVLRLSGYHGPIIDGSEPSAQIPAVNGDPLVENWRALEVLPAVNIIGSEFIYQVVQRSRLLTPSRRSSSALRDSKCLEHFTPSPTEQLSALETDTSHPEGEHRQKCSDDPNCHALCACCVIDGKPVGGIDIKACSGEACSDVKICYPDGPTVDSGDDDEGDDDDGEHLPPPPSLGTISLNNPSGSKEPCGEVSINGQTGPISEWVRAGDTLTLTANYKDAQEYTWNTASLSANPLLSFAVNKNVLTITVASDPWPAVEVIPAGFTQVTPFSPDCEAPSPLSSVVIIYPTKFGAPRIHRPAVLLDDQPPFLAPDQNEFPGLQTVLNSDNDRLGADKEDDGFYDINKPALLASSGPAKYFEFDNELAQVDIPYYSPKVSPSSLIRFSALEGGDSLRLWRITKEGAFAPIAFETGYAAEDLNFKLTSYPNPSPAPKYFQAQIYVEGRVPHTRPRESLVEMSIDGIGATYTSRFTVTVVGVQSLKWKGIGNGRTPGSYAYDSDTLDDDPLWEPEFLWPGVRVFPGARALGGNVETGFRDKVNLEVTLSVAPIEPLNIYLRSFDVDDPSEEAEFVDPNDAGIDGSYSGSNIPFTDEEDNRGEVFGLKAGWFTDQTQELGYPSTVFTKRLHFDAGQSVETAEFQVSHAPGDNYQVVASPDKEFLLDLRNRDSEDTFRIVDVSDESSLHLIPFSDKYMSDALTVWRLIHIESDSMLPVGPGDNVVLGMTHGVAHDPPSGSKGLGVDINLADGSPDLSSVPQSLGRFENGKIVFGFDGLERSIAGNGPSSIYAADLTLSSLVVGEPFTLRTEMGS
ncbi:MAG: hypothetical protein KDD53_04405, partial [Bdellovibrionales bacterium]|nr:hypothetical protein [Bdellovibrionales bacterium]